MTVFPDWKVGWSVCDFKRGEDLDGFFSSLTRGLTKLGVALRYEHAELQQNATLLSAFVRKGHFE